MRRLIAITGTIGSGKTTVSDILRKHGYTVFDADSFSRKILTEEAMVTEVLENIIGQTVSADNIIDFKKVGALFDMHPEWETTFETWYQPFLGTKIKQRIASLDENGIYFFDIPLLHQKNIPEVFDSIWLITADEADCRERIRKRNGYADEKMELLITNSRLPRQSPWINCIVITNNGSLEELEQSVLLKLSQSGLTTLSVH